MYLFELTHDPKLITLIAATDQLKTDLDSGKISQNWTLDQLLHHFRKFNLVLSPNDIYNMIKQKPLKNVISNVQGDEVVFKGLEAPKQPEAPPPEQSKEVVSKMAQNALP